FLHSTTYSGRRKRDFGVPHSKVTFPSTRYLPCHRLAVWPLRARIPRRAGRHCCRARLPPVRNGPPGKLVAVHRGDHEPLGMDSQPRPLPPLAADGPARDIAGSQVAALLDDVGVPLEDRLDVVTLDDLLERLTVLDHQLRRQGDRGPLFVLLEDGED